MKNINLDKIVKVVNKVGKYSKQHLSTILIISGLGLTVAAKFQAEREAVKYNSKVEYEDNKRREAKEPTMDRWERTKLYFEYCWLSNLMETVGCGAVLYAHKIDLAKITALTTLYQFAKKEGFDLKEMIKNETSNTTLQNLQKKILNDDDQSKVDFENLKARCYETNLGNTMFNDDFIGATFHSSVSEVIEAFTDINDRLREEADDPNNDGVGFVELSELYELLHLPKKKRIAGKYMAFRCEKDSNNRYHGLLDIHRVMDWKDYVDPVNGEPRICFLKYYSYLTTSDEFEQNRPYYYHQY